MDLEGENEEKLKRAIVAGSILGSIYFFDQLAAEEWYVKTKDDDFELKRRTILQEIFE